VLRNLINNAIKFTPNGGSVNISSKQSDASVEISVIDTGVGLKPDQMKGCSRSVHIFQPWAPMVKKEVDWALCYAKKWCSIMEAKYGL